jgi:transposase
MPTKLSPPKRLFHLPIVMDVIRRMKLIGIIDKVVKEDPRSIVSTGDCIGVMLCAIFSGAHDLYRVRERLDRYDMKTIMRNQKFDIERFPEERLAKALDDIWRAGPDKLITSIAVQLIESFSIKTDFFHFDTTSLTCYGAYEVEDDLQTLSGDMPPKVTYGHSKDRRPDLKQILYGMMVSSDGGVPVFGQVLDGNQSDNISTAAFFARVRSLVEDPRKVACVADSKGWCGRVLSLILDQDMRLLSRLPRNHGVHHTIMSMKWEPTDRIEIQNKRHKHEPPEIYEFFGCDIDENFSIPEIGEDGKEITKRSLTVPARAVRVFSSALLKRKISTLGRIRRREERQAKAFIRDHQKRAYACDDDAKRAATRDRREARYITIDLHASIQHHDGTYRKGRGRPPKNKEPGINVPHWRVVYSTSPVAEEVSKDRLKETSSFIIIRNRQKGWNISDAEMIMKYKGQYHNEHGFSWMKSRAVMNPVFLKTPHRIASLGFLYCIGLMIWTIIQRTIRHELIKKKQLLPHHNRRMTNNITTRFILELFQEVHSQILTHSNGSHEVFIHGITKYNARACRCLGSKLSIFKPVFGTN